MGNIVFLFCNIVYNWQISKITWGLCSRLSKRQDSIFEVRLNTILLSQKKFFQFIFHLKVSIRKSITCFRLQFIHVTSIFLGVFQSAWPQQVDGIVVVSVIEDIHRKAVTNKMPDLNTCSCSAPILCFQCKYFLFGWRFSVVWGWLSFLPFCT